MSSAMAGLREPYGPQLKSRQAAAGGHPIPTGFGACRATIPPAPPEA